MPTSPQTWLRADVGHPGLTPKLWVGGVCGLQETLLWPALGLAAVGLDGGGSPLGWPVWPRRSAHRLIWSSRGGGSGLCVLKARPPAASVPAKPGLCGNRSSLLASMLRLSQGDALLSRVGISPRARGGVARRHGLSWQCCASPASHLAPGSPSQLDGGSEERAPVPGPGLALSSSGLQDLPSSESGQSRGPCSPDVSSMRPAP